MSKASRIIGVVGLLLAFFISTSSQAIAAQGPKVALEWQVQWGVKRDGIWQTRWFAKSNRPTSLYSTVYFGGIPPSGVQISIPPEGVTRWFAGPPHMYQAVGFQLAKDSSSNSFAGIRWNSARCLPGPEITVRWSGAKKTVVSIKNTTANTIFSTVNGGRTWKKILAGGMKSYTRLEGEVFISTERTLSNPCASVWWRPK